MLKNGTIVGKWSHNSLPDKKELKELEMKNYTKMRYANLYNSQNSIIFANK
jgi:hypothetical protein